MSAGSGDLVINGVLTPAQVGTPTQPKPDTDSLTNILIYPKAGNTFTGCQVYFEASYDGTNWFPVAAYDQAQNAWLPGLVNGIQTPYPTSDNAARGYQIQSAAYAAVRVRPSQVLSGIPSVKLVTAAYFASSPVSTGGASSNQAIAINNATLVELRKIFLALVDNGQLDAESIRVRGIFSIADDFAVAIPAVALTGNPSGSPM